MPTDIAHVSIPISVAHLTSTAPPRAGRRVIGVLLGIWAAVAVLLAAVIVAMMWDLRP